GFGRGEARDLVRGLRGGRSRIAEQAERLRARRLELAHDQLAVPRAGAPVDAAQRIAGPVLASAEHLVSRPGARRRDARLELPHVLPLGQRFESRQNRDQLEIDFWSTPAKEPERIAALAGPPARRHETAAQRTALATPTPTALPT